MEGRGLNSGRVLNFFSAQLPEPFWDPFVVLIEGYSEQRVLSVNLAADINIG
jgi:hypothetical protein